MIVTKESLNGYFEALKTVKFYLYEVEDSLNKEYLHGIINKDVYVMQCNLTKGIISHVQSIEDNYKEMFIRDEDEK